MLLTTPKLLGALPGDGRQRLLECAREVSFPEGTRLFEEGRRADHFWVIRSGAVSLDVRVPTRPSAVVETLCAGDLLGWSWLFPPYEWHLGARAVGPVHALEFDAVAVRDLCGTDPELGRALCRHVAGIVAHRLQRTRARLLDLYGPYGLSSLGEELA